MTSESGVEYFAIDAAPGMKFFRCERMSATLSTRGCGQNYTAASRPENVERLHHCRNCPIGAAHTGGEPVHLSPYYGGNICARCKRPSSRIIHKRICVSCQNREYEIIKGRNAKGVPPTKLPPLHPRQLTAYVGGRIIRRRIERTLDGAEVMLSILRNERGAIRFGMAAYGPGRAA